MNSAFLDKSQKFSPSLRGKPVISTQIKTNMLLICWAGNAVWVKSDVTLSNNLQEQYKYNCLKLKAME